MRILSIAKHYYNVARGIVVIYSMLRPAVPPPEESLLSSRLSLLPGHLSWPCYDSPDTICRAQAVPSTLDLPPRHPLSSVRTPTY